MLPHLQRLPAKHGRQEQAVRLERMPTLEHDALRVEHSREATVTCYSILWVGQRMHGVHQLKAVEKGGVHTGMWHPT